MRQLPETLPDEGILVGWSLEAGQRKPVMGFRPADPGQSSPSRILEPILDTGEGHLLTVAPTGAGKGTGCIIPALLRYPGPVVVVDPKGENYEVTARRRREMGQEVILLDPFEITDAKERHRFNPLDLADPASDHFVEDISTLATLIGSGPENRDDEKNSFWLNMGKILVTAVIVDVMTAEDSEKATLPAVRDMVNSSVDDLRKRAEKWGKSSNSELRRLAGIFSNPAMETFGGYWAFAINQLDFMKGKQLEEHLSSSDLDLNKIYDGSPLSVYLVLPPDKLESHASLLRLWIGSIISVITRRRQRPKHSTLLLIDEAAQLGELPHLRQAITLLRGYGVRVWSFWQDMSQLRNLYPNDWETILNNSRIQQFFGATTGMSAEVVSRVSGFGTPEAVMDLERDELILNITGDEPVIARKPNYRLDPPFRGLYDDNPFYSLSGEASEEACTRPVYRKTKSPALRYKAIYARQGMILANRIFHPVSPKSWHVLSGEERTNRIHQAGITSDEVLNDPRMIARRCLLPFYSDFDWYEIEDTRTSPALHSYFLMSNDKAFFLNGASAPVHDVNELQELMFNRENIQLYLEFFCTSVHGEAGRFLVVDSADEIEWREMPAEAFLDDLRKQIHPPRIVSVNEESDQTIWIMEAVIVYEDGIFFATFKIQGKTGYIEMTDEKPLAGDMPVIPDLDRLKYVGLFDANGKFRGLRGEA